MSDYGIWSWVLSCSGLTGMFLVGRKKWWAWFIPIVNEILWIPYSFGTKQYGFVFGSLAAITIHSINIRRWKKQAVQHV